MKFPLLKRESLLGSLAALLARLLFMTLRLNVTDRSGFLQEKKNLAPLIIVFWHNRIPAIATTFLRHYPHQRRKGVVVLTSPSKDGAILAATMDQLGMGAVRGSSSRRGATALRELQEKMREGYDIAITPDGPRGPKYRLSPGLLFLAQKSGASILPVHATYEKAHYLKTWDSFAIPLPFSRLNVTLDRLITIDPNLDDLEPTRQALEQQLQSSSPSNS